VALRFGECRFDRDARQLFRAGVEVHLSPKSFELLKVLIEGRPRALSKSELLDRVWPGVFVSEASLARVVNELRQGVGETGGTSPVIRTVHGYGYAFAADAVDDDSARPPAKLGARPVGWLTCGARQFALWEGEQFAGRDPDNGIYLDSPKVSRRHARIVVVGTSSTIEDLTSKNGTFVGGARISTPTPLAPGDHVQIGPFTLILSVAAPLGATETHIS
jgi:DNA-binding winged helix-turn-helix (wHTH) protein